MSVESLTKAMAANARIDGNNDEAKPLSQKFKFIVTHITVEPLILLAMVPSIMNRLATQNLYLEKSCRVNLQFNSSVCDAMTTRNSAGYELNQEAEVQKMVSRMIAIKMIVTGSWPVFLMLFLGSWSDRHGRRKPLILAPLIGDLVGTILLLVSAHYLLELPVEYSMMAETIPIALGGTWGCGFLGIYTYVSGLCKDEEKTIRIGVVTMCQMVSITIGNILSGFSIDLLGFKGVYTLSIITLSLSLIYGLFMIKENPKSDIKLKEKPFFVDFFSLEHIKNTFLICFKKGYDNRREKIVIIMFLSTVIMGSINGESAVIYLFTRRKFGWNEIDFSIFNSVVFVVDIIGGSFALAFFSKYLKVHDSLLGIIAVSSKMLSDLLYAFAPNGSIFYIGGFIELFQSTCHISMRTLMSKTVAPHELGQSNSVFGIFEAITPLIFGPLYSTIYSKTIKSFPSMFFLCSAGLHLVTLSLFSWLYWNEKNQKLQRISEPLKDNEAEILNVEQCDIEK